MEMNPNGTCKICSDRNGPMWQLPDSLKKAKDRVEAKVQEEVSEPVHNVMQITLVAGTLAGVAAGALYLWRRLRK
jgi:hypothetical protein